MTSIAAGTDIGIDPAAWLAGFDSGRAVGELEAEVRGRRDGYAAGRADEADERDRADEIELEAWRDQVNRTASALVASRTPFDQLCERRGEPERAAAQRRLLAARGVTA